MIFSGRHYLALSRAYPKMFAPVPLEVAQRAGELGNGRMLFEALFQAVHKTQQPILDWTPFVTRSPASSAPTVMEG